MKKINGNQLATSIAAASNQSQKQSVADVAIARDRPKNDFYQMDKWIVGTDVVKTYMVPKNTLPEPLLKAFTPSTKPEPVTDELDYDQTKFELDDWPDSEFAGGRVVVGLCNPPISLADVRFDKNIFVISLSNLPKSGTFSFSKDEFLKAIHVAKWDLELFGMPKSDKISSDE